ncbi:hypothetical protein DDB_G0268568 [Dictyostelium discoideum AX4]|uniref:Uncharacterized protein n=1 Tax=Dictyostelium discoideum TaxID=44689 RepID=Q55FK6_DICDI|nr:hypothetical protein DDB_G0268568 [Dictyostelium discoideum AX4]EAL73737.1 hypothetical protein DDB_G0268568 [Dictyostelium discoideum AX4]|eukprot:XP_647527.1 hypothetical protein DDB_G0268568 [Dictyostelium discoideum AX4]
MQISSITISIGTSIFPSSAEHVHHLVNLMITTFGNCICNYVAIGTDCKTLNLQLDSVTPTFVTGGQVHLNV